MQAGKLQCSRVTWTLHIVLFPLGGAIHQHRSWGLLASASDGRCWARGRRPQGPCTLCPAAHPTYLEGYWEVWALTKSSGVSPQHQVEEG